MGDIRYCLPHHSITPLDIQVDAKGAQYFSIKYHEKFSTIYSLGLFYNAEGDAPMQTIQCVHVYMHWPESFNYNDIKRKIPPFSNIRELHFYLPLNFLIDCSAKIIERFAYNSKQQTISYHFPHPIKGEDQMAQCCKGCQELCKNCTYRVKKAEMVSRYKYVCFEHRRMVEPGQTITPFDVEDDYKICSTLYRKDNGLETVVYECCPYYVEHFLMGAKSNA